MKSIKILFLTVFTLASIGLSFADSNPNGCGKYALEGAPNNGYEGGFYSGYLKKPDVTTLNFCSIPYDYPTLDQTKYYTDRQQAKINNGVWTRNCKYTSISSSDHDTDSCTARILPLEDTACLENNKAYDTKPKDLGLSPLCKKADSHGFVDPGFATAQNIAGGGSSPWTWTCAGEYYNSADCQAPSKGKCMDTDNVMYDDFIESSAICDNGAIEGFKFNEETYKRERTCKGSATEYNTACFASKTTENGQCNFVYNGKKTSEISTGDELCTRGLANDFQFNESNSDSAYGWSWLCEGSTPDLNAECFAPKETFQGACNTVTTSTAQEFLSTGSDLCSKGNATGLVLNEETKKRIWACQGSRTKDNASCQVSLKTTEGKCGVKNGTLCAELTSDNGDLCEKGTVSDRYRDSELGKRSWNCLGNPESLSVQCSATKTSPGLCNDEINGKTMTYEKIITYPLCKEGTTDINLDGAINAGTWNWTCAGLAGGSGSQCSVNQYQTGSCANLIGKVKTLPIDLCTTGKPISTQIQDGYRAWTCQGFNGGPSIQCSIACLDGTCEKSAGGGFCGNGSYCDAKHPCEDGTVCQTSGGGTCSDGSYCDATNVCKDGSTCDGIGGGNVPDGIIPTIGPGEMCKDVDGCMCGNNRIFNGTVCEAGNPYDPNDLEDPSNPNYKMPIFRPTLDAWGSLYDASMMLPGDADLILDHTTQTGNAKKLDQVSFDILYKNDGPDTAYGTYVAYKYSDLLENIDGSVPFTVVTVQSLQTNDKKIESQNTDNKAVTTTIVGTGVISGSIASGNAVTGTTQQVVDVNSPGSLDANNSSKAAVTGSDSAAASTKAYDDIYHNVIYFYIGTLEPGQTGKITFSGSVKNTLIGGIITNTAQIQSRLNDPNKLNNTKSASINMDIIYQNGGLNLINPLLYIKPTLDKRNSVIKRINATTDFRDVIIGHPWYMHIMTVQRNGIMKGYEYKYSTMFEPNKCISRAEYLVVMARVMHMTNDVSDVYASELKTTPYKDVPTTNQMLVKYVNRAHRKGLVDVFKAGKALPDVLGVNKAVQHKEAKEVFYRLYRIMNADTKVLQPLLVGTGNGFSNQCVTRVETAYTVAHILRGNQNIVMGFNDIFIGKLYEYLLPKSIITRRDLLSRLIFKVRQMSPGSLFKFGLDKETMLGVLDAAMKGKIYQPIHSTDSVDNFFYEVSDDEYDRYIDSLY